MKLNNLEIGDAFRYTCVTTHYYLLVDIGDHVYAFRDDRKSVNGSPLAYFSIGTEVEPATEKEFLEAEKKYED